jgi:transcriptional regulator with XRE-family HTH domain
MPTIRELREAKGWTQQDLAYQLGVAVSTVSTWEQGRFEPRATQLRKLAQVLGVPMEEIEIVPRGKAAGELAPAA